MNYKKCNAALPKETPFREFWVWQCDRLRHDVTLWHRVWADPYLRFDQIDRLGATQSDGMKRNKMRRDAKGTHLDILAGRPVLHLPYIWDTFTAQHILCVLVVGSRDTRVLWILIKPGVNTRCSVNSTACKDWLCILIQYKYTNGLFETVAHINTKMCQNRKIKVEIILN